MNELLLPELKDDSIIETIKTSIIHIFSYYEKLLPVNLEELFIEFWFSRLGSCYYQFFLVFSSSMKRLFKLLELKNRGNSPRNRDIYIG